MANEIILGIKIGATLSGAFHAAFGTASGTFNRLGTAAARLSERHNRLGTMIARAMSHPARNVSALTLQYNRLGQTLQQVQARSEALGRSMARDAELSRQRGALRGQALETVGTAFALGAPVLGAVRQAGNFQADLRNTAITGGFAGTSQEAGLGQVIRAEAVRTAQPTGVLNQAVGTLVAGGIQDVQALKTYVPVLGVAATAWNADMNDLSALALTTKDQFGIIATDFKSALNIAGTAGKEGQFEVKDMAKWMPALGAQLKWLGLVGKKGFAEAGAWLQVARMGAGSNDAAANNFQNFLGKITSQDTKKDFDKTGIDLQARQSELMQTGKSAIESSLMIIQDYMASQGPEAAKDFKTVLESKDEAERENALRRLNEQYKLGDLFQDMQAMNFIRPALDNMDRMREIADKSLASADANVLDADFGKNMETFNKQFERFKLSTAEVGITIGSALLPSLNSVMGSIGPIIQGFGVWAAANPGLVKGVIGLVGGLLAGKLAVIGLKYGFNLLLSPISGLMTAFNVLSGKWLLLKALWQAGGFAPLIGAFRSIGGALKFAAVGMWGLVRAGIAFAMTPIGLVIVGITALGALAYTVYKNWEPITAWFKTAWAAIGTAAGAVGSAVGGAFTSAANGVKTAWAGVMDWLAGKFAWIMDKVNWVKGLGGSLFGKGAVIGGAMATAVAMPAGATPLPPLPGAKAPQTINQTTNATIHVTQKPGEDQNALAERVASKLKRQQAADARGALHD